MVKLSFGMRRAMIYEWKITISSSLCSFGSKKITRVVVHIWFDCPQAIAALHAAP